MEAGATNVERNGNERELTATETGRMGWSGSEKGRNGETWAGMEAGATNIDLPNLVNKSEFENWLAFPAVCLHIVVKQFKPGATGKWAGMGRTGVGMRGNGMGGTGVEWAGVGAGGANVRKCANERGCADVRRRASERGRTGKETLEAPKGKKGFPGEG